MGSFTILFVIVNLAISSVQWIDASVVHPSAKLHDVGPAFRFRPVAFAPIHARTMKENLRAPTDALVSLMTRKWPRGGTLYVDQTGKRMSLIPTGHFVMGGTDGDPDEKPLHPVEITQPFYMDQTEVTADEYQKCVDAGVCKWKYAEFVWPWPAISREDRRQLGTKYCKGYRAHRRPGYPVNCIPFRYAERFCRDWRKGRLPSEAEWEWAARGGLERKKYQWGDQDFHGRSVSDRKIGPEPVAQYPPNGYGLYDMTGNVWEWVNDWYDCCYYRRSPARDPRGPCDGASERCGKLTDRGMRGGSWYEDGKGLRVSYRNHHGMNFTYRVVGFRCAADYQPPK